MDNKFENTEEQDRNVKEWVDAGHPVKPMVFKEERATSIFVPSRAIINPVKLTNTFKFYKERELETKNLNELFQLIIDEKIKLEHTPYDEKSNNIICTLQKQLVKEREKLGTKKPMEELFLEALQERGEHLGKEWLEREVKEFEEWKETGRNHNKTLYKTVLQELKLLGVDQERKTPEQPKSVYKEKLPSQEEMNRLMQIQEIHQMMREMTNTKVPPPPPPGRLNMDRDFIHDLEKTIQRARELKVKLNRPSKFKFYFFIIVYLAIVVYICFNLPVNNRSEL